MSGAKSSRRNFLKRLSLGLAAAGAGAAGLNGAEPESERPNVVLILTDDQGSVDLNCYGAKDLITPNLDRLASEGCRFTQMYVGAPVCSPSRAALMTGRYPQRAQLPNNAWGERGMPASQVTVAETLKKAGYKTALFGKWHMGDVLPLSPNAQGFDEFIGHKVGCIDNYSHFFYWRGPNKHDLWKNEEEYFEDGKYFPDMIVREAKRFISENKDRPFFLYLPFNNPPYPMQAQRKYAAMYEDMENPDRKRYAAFVTMVDDKIGEVVRTLEDQGLRRKTVVIFLSDHGHSVEERAFGGGGSAGPYRGHKFTVWEGGVRVPCIISQPGKIPQGATRDQMVVSMDLFPTISEYCGARLPERKIDGRSIADVIANADAPSPHQTLHWESGGMWAVRDGKWKLVKEKNGDLFLSNMDKDVTETKNLAGAHPDQVKRLQALHKEWRGEVEKQ